MELLLARSLNQNQTTTVTTNEIKDVFIVHRGQIDKCTLSLGGRDVSATNCKLSEIKLLSNVGLIERKRTQLKLIAGFIVILSKIKIKKLICDSWMIYKQRRREFGLEGFSYLRFSETYFTQYIY